MNYELFGVFLRPHDGDIAIEAVMTPKEVGDRAGYLLMRMRYQQDMRGSWFKMPPGSTSEQVADAIEALGAEERLALYRRFGESPINSTADSAV